MLWTCEKLQFRPGGCTVTISRTINTYRSRPNHLVASLLTCHVLIDGVTKSNGGLRCLDDVTDASRRGEPGRYLFAAGVSSCPTIPAARQRPTACSRRRRRGRSPSASSARPRRQQSDPCPVGEQPAELFLQISLHRCFDHASPDGNRAPAPANGRAARYPSTSVPGDACMRSSSASRARLYRSRRLLIAARITSMRFASHVSSSSYSLLIRGISS